VGWVDLAFALVPLPLGTSQAENLLKSRSEKMGTKKAFFVKLRRRPFFFLISLGWIYLWNLYLQSRFMASPWGTSVLRILNLSDLLKTGLTLLYALNGIASP
jgi:hypothetical protein